MWVILIYDTLEEITFLRVVTIYIVIVKIKNNIQEKKEKYSKGNENKLELGDFFLKTSIFEEEK